ncbi:hypothetical protein SSX86_024599 [Deinandra increscens subsp. villosa]|uniref:C2 domain-containing protein n=1 Tax=Deinandra increscens subsp. villosa TaxID=3103831 RepID=A0AAP0CGC5_9ASTR
MSKEKLVVEVLGAHNLMPKDGEGSCSAFVEVEFEGQRQRTQVKYKDLNPVWNEKLVFHVNDVADLPYRTIEVNVFNEKRSNNSRNFLGKVRVSGTSIAREGEDEVNPQLIHTLDKRSLFSHVRGEITFKLYLSLKGGSGGVHVVSGAKKANKFHHQHQQQQQQSKNAVVQTALGLQQNVKKIMTHPNNQMTKKPDPNKNDLKPVVIPGPPINVPVPTPGPGGRVVFSGGSNDYSLKETKPHLGGGPLNKDKTSSTYDLVEQVQYLYIRVVKARGIPVTGGGEVVAEVKLGNYRGITKRVALNNNAEWDQVFAFCKDTIQSSNAEIFVKERDKDDEILGRVWFDLTEVPKRVPPDSQLAPQWYRMDDDRSNSSKLGGEVMVAIWFGTQADEAFSEAWHSKAANVHLDGLCSIQSKVYLSPKLWYLRVSVIEAQDVVLGEKGMRYPELNVKVQVGNQVMKTRVAAPAAAAAAAMGNRILSNPFWNEDLMFVVAEPFEDYVMLSVEDRVGPNREEVVGRVVVPVSVITRRLDSKEVPSRWYNLDHGGNTNEAKSSSSVRFAASRIHIRAMLEGGYHVLDEATMYSSDVRPTAKQLWKPHVGVVEMGILGASNLMPMKLKDGKGGSTDAYCVAKYGQKWVRTRTVVDSLAPKWNEQYTWEVFDPCTVITIGVFDNSRVDKSPPSGAARDSRIGKVRIRLSTLESDRVYTHAYPLLMLHPSGMKKMGELHLAVRFSSANMLNMLHMYTMPLLPKMHYVQPLSVNQLESLRYQALNVVAARLSRAEPSLGREVVEYMLDHDSHMWSMRKSRANFFRLTNVVAWLVFVSRVIENMRNWNTPVSSSMFVVMFLFMVLMPELIIPLILLGFAVIGLWRYRFRPRYPPHMDTRLSYAEGLHPDELDEEFDSFPTSTSAEIVRIRYDRLRSVAGRIQTVVGDMATQGERFQALLSWRDPRASFLFVVICLLAAIGFYLVPIRLVVGVWGLYFLRPPRFRSKLPSSAVSFIKRLPTMADSML